MTYTEQDKKTNRIADEIVDQFIRLSVSTDDDACSGLMARIPNVVSEVCLVNVYDDYVDVDYDGEALLAHLKTLEPEDVSLSSEATNNIWQAIRAFEA